MGGGGERSRTKFLSESQNGRPAVTAGCSDHKWTSHNEPIGITRVLLCSQPERVDLSSVLGQTEPDL